jgi:hypothetical protein
MPACKLSGGLEWLKIILAIIWISFIISKVIHSIEGQGLY